MRAGTLVILFLLLFPQLALGLILDAPKIWNGECLEQIYGLFNFTSLWNLILTMKAVYEMV